MSQSSKPKRVRIAVVGAGPAGLVAAKTLLQYRVNSTTAACRPYKVSMTVFEQSSSVGGLWPNSPDNKDSYIDPQVPVNFSRFSVAFSDLDWHKVDIDGHELPLYPKAWMAGRYLDTYAELNGLYGKIRLGHKVESIQHAGSESQGPRKWKLTVSVKHIDMIHVCYYDYVVIATGFFAHPKPLKCLHPALRELKSVEDTEGYNATLPRLIHSSQYRKLDDLFPAGLDHLKEHESPKILVIGGGNSAGDTAALIASQLEVFTRKEAHHLEGGYLSLKVYHATPHAFYPVPWLVKAKDSEGRPRLLPRDFALFELGRRGCRRMEERPITRSSDPEAMRQQHVRIRDILGDALQGLPESIVPKEVPYNEPYHLLQTDAYAGLVRSGNIVPVRGRVSEVGQPNYNWPGNPWNDGYDVILNNGSVISDVIAIVHANGYTSTPASQMLSPEILEALEYDEGCHRLPFVLGNSQTQNPSVSGLGFVGVFEGVAWGLFEMQARMLASSWLADGASTADGRLCEKMRSEMFAHCLKKDFDAIRELRVTIKQGHQNLPQYLFQDHGAYMKEAICYNADEFKGTRQNEEDAYEATPGPSIPSHFPTPARSDRFQASFKEARKVNHAAQLLFRDGYQEEERKSEDEEPPSAPIRSRWWAR